MTWTKEQKLRALLGLRWTIDVQKEDDGSIVARAQEIPSAIAVASSDEIDEEFWASLSASLEVYLDQGDAIPLPPGTKLPWEVPVAPPRPDVVSVTYTPGEVWEGDKGKKEETGASVSLVTPSLVAA